jgi:peptidoglycan hydrolase FlgJ
MTNPVDNIATPAATKMPVTPMGTPVSADLWKTAQEFEEVFLGQLTKAMRSSSMKGGLLDDSIGRETYQGLLSESLGKEMAQQGALGLTDNLYRSLGGRYRKLDNASKTVVPTIQATTPKAAATSLTAAIEANRNRMKNAIKFVNDIAENPNAS